MLLAMTKANLLLACARSCEAIGAAFPTIVILGGFVERTILYCRDRAITLTDPIPPRNDVLRVTQFLFR